jgi:hypothetical protein
MRTGVATESPECRATWAATVVRVINRDGAAEQHKQIRVQRALLPLALAALEEPEQWAMAESDDCCVILTGPAVEDWEVE